MDRCALVGASGLGRSSQGGEMLPSAQQLSTTGTWVALISALIRGSWEFVLLSVAVSPSPSPSVFLPIFCDCLGCNEPIPSAGKNLL